MSNDAPLIIAGASYAGLQLAATARELGYAGRIIMVGDERHLPYQRPPLSKGLLTGKTTADKLPLRSEEFYRENGIETLLNQRVTRIEPDQRRVHLADGGTLDYAWLALMTGARCRPLPVPGAELNGVHMLRTLGDGLRIAEYAKQVKTACVIGGGFIGLEVASALQTCGVQVTVIEAQPRLLARNFPLLMSDYVLRAHRARGVQVELGRGVRTLHGDNGRVAAVELTDGTRIACELVVAGIGVVPNDELAREAGIATDNGILVDACGRTSVERILAAGDVANMQLPSWGPDDSAGRYRLESIQAANDGAKACASVIAGQPKPCTTVPWFWSDQFELKFQMAGLPQASDEIVVRGDISSNKFSLFYLRGGHVAAVHTVNRPAEHMLSRRLIAANAALAPRQAADEGFDLKSILNISSTSSGAESVA
ncbi:pyridine nucleotide-disulfide oxidoreductase [Noviherbaspirillum cavernae]|uniref:Pyridine nucleotide-disulfide oxidoreductase n=1 Tax=Noviherbaspirillum cavernae TaxID=2320862 RepID=A0A418WX01_9BURK|nr:FAD-dependent oxidoreductase [Noviherbaspirillum cavernae]RJG04766.1 pyridine nucleotide-disulfide oxidoreductase [Noviherbaspirillum cavernae]